MVTLLLHKASTATIIEHADFQHFWLPDKIAATAYSCPPPGTSVPTLPVSSPAFLTPGCRQAAPIAYSLADLRRL